MEGFKTLYLNFLKELCVVDKTIFKKYYKKQKTKQYDMKFIKSFFDRLQPFEKDIKEKNLDIIYNKAFCPLLKIRFYDLWDNISDNNKEQIFNHIRTCYLVAQYTLQNSEISKKVEEEEKKTSEVELDTTLAQGLTELEKDLEKSIDNIDDETKDKINNLQKELSDCLPENLLEDLFKDYSTTNIEDLFKDDGMIKNMAKTVEEKIKSGEIDQDKLLESAKGMLGTFGDILGDSKNGDLMSSISSLMGGGEGGADLMSSIAGLLGGGEGGGEGGADLMSSMADLLGGGKGGSGDLLSTVSGLLGGGASSASNPIGSVMNIVSAMNSAPAVPDSDGLTSDEKAMLRRYRKKKENHRALLKQKLKSKQRRQRKNRQKK